MAEVVNDRSISYKSNEPFAVPGLTITSFYLDQLTKSKNELLYIGHHWLVKDFNKEIIYRTITANLSGICPTPVSVVQELVKEAHAGGLVVRGWSVKTYGDIIKLAALGVDGATTNWPDKAKKILYLQRET